MINNFKQNWIFTFFFTLAILGPMAESAQAGETIASEMHKAAGIALQKFTSENPDHSKHLNGYSIVKSGNDLVVKMMVAHGNMQMNFDYLCLKVSSGYECQSQNN